MEKKKLILIGAGMRGKSYTDTAFKMDGRFEVVAVAEPVDDRRNYIKKKHSLPDDMCFKSWEPLMAMDKFADAVVIATMDKGHFGPTMAAIEKGYEILLEKPIAPTPEECIKISEAANKKGVNVLVCHVLRYTPFFRLLKKTIDDGVIGTVYNVQHAEHVGNTHQSHSFVRGNWRNSEESSCMILQKCCHDLDIIQWLLDKPCKRIQSFGSLSYFTPENAPEGAPERCTDGCPHADECYYNAIKLYYDDKKNGWFRTTSTKKVAPTDEDVMETLRTTDYGKCVFKCPNNVVDHQVVNMEFEGGATASMTMEAFSKNSRCSRFMGTKGEIIANMADDHITIYDFATNSYRQIKIADAFAGDQTINGGHGGGDPKILDAFYDLLCGNETSKSVCNVSVACANHMLAFAAEESRISGRVIDVEEYVENIKKGI